MTPAALRSPAPRALANQSHPPGGAHFRIFRPPRRAAGPFQFSVFDGEPVGLATVAPASAKRIDVETSAR